MELAFDIGQQLMLGEGSAAKSIDKVFSFGTFGQGFFYFFWLIIKNLYILTGIILFIMIVIGGVGMIANAGNAEKQKQSSQTLTSAVVGYIIMFAAYWIIRIVELITGLNIFRI